MASKCAAYPRCCRWGPWRRRVRGEGSGRWGRGKVQVGGRVEADDVTVRVRGSGERAFDGGRQEGEEQAGGERGRLRQR